MADMTRREVRITNRVANALVNRHHMCLDCAIKVAVAFAKSHQRPEHEHRPVTTNLCSSVCVTTCRRRRSNGRPGEISRRYVARAPARRTAPRRVRRGRAEPESTQQRR